MRKLSVRLRPVQIIAIGFALIVFCGALLLLLPFAGRNGEGLSFFDALFTAVSAVCVTGLTVVDIWSRFSGFGQAVLLVLIQIGGLGFMSVTIFFFLVMGKKIGLRQRSLLMEAMSSLNLGGIVLLVKRVLIGTAIFELGGAALLSLRFCPALGLGRGIWFALFHAVSAFCNAGFDLMGVFGAYSSLTPFAGDALVNTVIMALILIGGIGFFIWGDLIENGLRFSSYSLHTKIMLFATAVLVLAPAVVFFFSEADGAFAGMSLGERVLASFFQSVTFRTAGFNTADFTNMSGGGWLVSLFLMFVGGGVGSTAGGVKVTSIVAVALSSLSVVSGKKDAEAFGRRLDAEQVSRAYAICVYTLILALAGSLIILLAQPLPAKDVLFETFSAVCTVGVSTGITRELAPVSRIVIMLLMYIGRLGSVSALMAVAEKRGARLQLPVEKIIIG